MFQSIDVVVVDIIMKAMSEVMSHRCQKTQTFQITASHADVRWRWNRMTREKEIYLLKALLTMCEFKDAFGNPVPQSAYVEAVSEAIKALESQREWIPCSERLPENDGLYLVTTSKGQVQMHVFSYNGNSEEYWTRCNKAWMPLSEPYKEGE